ncbi:type VI secretion system membrane subunit TssM [Ralstonia wenshanensis]|uniref:type VI secretion system membrane subunit TssM n=1 Tax=Ralstonia wenshanensis TaxID=2842456 RepID=UPI0021B498E0|nr:type VI secretion system membrane subunit TssM [Ralstonia wenshanensis]MCT7306460.1 type VI secretion system membrane subunit TssM [Ralstonia wenshanensis]
MEMLKRIGAILFSRQALALVAALLVAAAIWFIGPLLSFSGMQPLASVGTRVTVIVLLLTFVLLWLAGWPVSTAGVAALCLLIWHAGPLVAIGNGKPLEPASIRILLIAGIVFLFVSYALSLLIKRARTDRTFLEQVLNFGGKPKEAAAKVEITQLADAIQRALRQLKGMRGVSGFRRLVENKRYLYELPWFMMIGPAGAGKTTALLNAGMQFPIADQMRASVGSHAGTVHTDWWLTNDTVLIDTAGRYTTRESNASIDSAEWQGLLGLLRKYRTRAPINGALLAVSTTDLLTLSPEERIAQASMLRARLAELRDDLGIQFPVYVVVTKLDQLVGFTEYFQYLSSEGRTQPWGFTLPLEDKKGRRGMSTFDVLARCREEMALLVGRLRGGLNNRFYEEFDEARRKRMLAFRPEFSSLTPPLMEMLEHVFLDSRFDDTERRHTLRGVYFTSATQSEHVIAGDYSTIFRKLERGEGRFKVDVDEPKVDIGNGIAVDPAKTTGNRSYFLQDVLKRIVVPEAYLVRPNLRWEIRFRLLRLLGHALSLVVFLWLVGALYVSFGHNKDYLGTVQNKAKVLGGTVTEYFKKPQPEAMPEVLAAAHELPVYHGLNPAAPDLDWRLGLYTAPPLLAAAKMTDIRLQDALLVPYLVRRVENVLSSAISNKDAKLTYDTLRVYLMFYDKEEFNASDVRSWVQADWTTGGGADAFGGRVAIAEHLNSLLDGSRPIQSPYAKNETLIRSARDFLDGNTSTERLYDRAKAAMMEEAPPDFTLVRSIGPQAGTVFSRASGEPVERGIPGLFTYAGYHELFNARLPEFVNKAQLIDAWVMGRTGIHAQKKTLEGATGKLTGNDPVAREIRRLYLTEYAQHWAAFLTDIRAVTGNNLAFDLEVLRNFAAPDSPLARLGRVVVRETTLSQPVEREDRSVADKALAVLDKKSDKISGFAARAEARQERELVDSRFTALREIVTGQADVAVSGAQAASGKPRLDAIASMVNAYYTSLVVASNALETRNLPPHADAGAQLRMEAAKLPAPLKEVLADLVVQGTRDVNKGIGDILIAQMNAMIGESCRSAVDGKYPFNPTSAQDVDTEDFFRVFASGGVLDDFFQKVLAPHVDTTISPWRYKLSAPDVPPVAGPSLIPFQRAKEIREVFFRDPGAKKMAWKVDMKVVELDPEIVELNMDFDGQSQRYVHGPVIPLKVTWPGPRGGQGAEITANPRVRPDTSTLTANGPWAMMRVIAKGKLANSVSPSHFVAEYDFDGRKAKLDINTGSLANPWTTGLLQGFQCPGRSG